jgi:hypothetical protein
METSDLAVSTKTADPTVSTETADPIVPPGPDLGALKPMWATTSKKTGQPNWAM